MKIILAVASALFAVAGTFAAAPDEISGSVYYESHSLIGVGMARSSTSFAVALNKDRTYTALFVTSNLYALGGGPYLYAHVDGTYSYKKIDNQTAELSLDGFPDGSPESPLRRLNFTGATAGSIQTGPTDWFTYRRFRLAPAGTTAPLVNCSNRSFVQPGGTAFSGFVIAPGESRTVLVRAVGPGLASFGVTGTFGNPRLTVVNAANNLSIAANDDWSSDPAAPPAYTGRADAINRTSALVGAFPLVANSKDAAAILTLGPGAYIAQTSSTDASDSGQALIEIYLLP